MKVLNLRCANGHGFEGWFGSHDDFLDQNGRGLIECPLCSDKVISRMPNAPRLNISGARPSESREPAPSAAAPNAEPAAKPQSPELQAMWLHAMRHVVKNTEDVGERFADEARRIHHGEVPSRGIRGQASKDEAQALRDEGIDVLPLQIPQALKEPLQ
jgi:hypothetical protein